MQGSSRKAVSGTRAALNRTLSGAGDPLATARDLFAIVDVIDANATLRRALGDPTGEPHSKKALVQRLFAGKVGYEALDVLNEAAGERWSNERDLSDALERMAIEATTASAERNVRADDLENQLFRFERAVAGNAELRDALSERGRAASDKDALVSRLLNGKVTPETMLLAQRAGAHPRGRKFEGCVTEMLDGISARRGQSQALVTSAVALNGEQADRLRNALSKMYAKPVQLNQVVDPHVMGGIKIEIGDDVIDGTIARRLDEARTHLSG